MSNTALWDSVCKTDPNEVKAITGKTYSGNSPKPYYIIRRLTETFGACGTGWGFDIKEQDYKVFGDTTIHVARVRLWYVRDDKRGEVEQIGQTKMAYTSAAGKLIVDEDAPKKSVTDALIKCASYLGFAGDIFSGRWDDSGYVAGLRQEFGEQDAKASYDALVVAKMGIITNIKTGIANQDLAFAKESWDELSNDEKSALWKAPTKGGIFTTSERTVIQSSEFRTALDNPMGSN
jgi:hypothetical protein